MTQLRQIDINGHNQLYDEYDLTFKPKPDSYKKLEFGVKVAC